MGAPGGAATLTQSSAFIPVIVAGPADDPGPDAPSRRRTARPGNCQAAHDLHQDTLDRWRETLGAEHELTVATTASLAADLRALAGEPDG